MNNQEFLDIVAQSFVVFLETGSRSNQKLKILNGAISNYFQKRLGVLYKIKSLGKGLSDRSRFFRRSFPQHPG